MINKQLRIKPFASLLIIAFSLIFQSCVEKAVSEIRPQAKHEELKQFINVEVKQPGGKEVKELLTTIRDEQLRQNNPERVIQAITQLGERRGVEASDDLTQLLTFKRSLESDVTQIRSHFDDLYPARSALFLIGKPSLPALIKAIESHESDSLASENAINTIMAIYQDSPSEGVEHLREASKSSSPEGSQRLLKAAEIAAKRFVR